MTNRSSRRSTRRREARRRRAVAGVVLLALVVAVVWAAFVRGAGDVEPVEAVIRPAAKPPVSKPRSVAQSEPERRPSDKARLKLRTVIGGNISPKSVTSSGAGHVTAQNMLYRHSVTVYDARSLRLVKTISDAVDLRRLGYPSYPGTSRGAPVEAAFSPDGRYAYVSNYSMYGRAFGSEGSDSCTPSSGYDESFVYRIDMERLKINGHIGWAPCRRSSP